MAKTSLVLTILGKDRPGLVDSLAETVASHQGNWIESRMAHLAGQFAGILRVEVDPQQADGLTQAIRALQQDGLESVIHHEAAPAEPPEKSLVHLELVGQDRPGIVREIGRVLAAKGVNVEELRTECASAATTGQPLFKASAQLQLPGNVTTESLRQTLEALAEDMMVDITLE